MLHTFAVVFLISAGFALKNYVEIIDANHWQETMQAMLSREDYREFPEVIALKRQGRELGYKGNGRGEGHSNASVPTQRKIELRLNQKLSSLYEEYNAKLDQLIVSARKEYSQIKSGHKSGSKTELIHKYLKLVKELELECDVRVYATIVYARNQLDRYGYDRSCVEQAKEIYQQMKKERRQRLLKS